MDPIFSKGVGDGATQDAWIWLQTLAFGAPLSSDQEVENCSLALACHDLQIDLIRAGFLVCSLPVKRRILNKFQTLHGGVTATLVQVIGSAVIKTVVGAREGIVTDANISYISSVLLNAERGRGNIAIKSNLFEGNCLWQRT
eukprot:c20757_g2_i4 orf=585-1010(-)